MARMNLTDAALERYKPKTSRDEIFDKQARGLGVRVTPGGKTFFVIRRVNGAKVRFSLGQYPAVTLASARKAAFDIIDKIKAGGDPREEYSIRRKAGEGDQPDTFAHVAGRFIGEYAEGKKRPLSEATIKGYRWALQGSLIEKWAAKPLADIADRDVIRVIDQLEAEGHFASARLFRAYQHKFWNWCIGKRLVRDNPARGVGLGSTPEDFKRERHLSIPDLQAVMAAADKLVNVNVKNGNVRRTGEPQRAIIWTLILTGQRKGETSLMKWSDLTLEGDQPVWKIPPENTKNSKAHEVPLSPEVIEVITRLPRMGEFVFTTDGHKPINGFSKLKVALDKALVEAGVTIEPWRLHDLRRSVATGLGELGFPPHVIEMTLNHVSGEKASVSGLYNRSKYLPDCRRALVAWAQAVTGGAAGNVVAMNAHEANRRVQ